MPGTHDLDKGNESTTRKTEPMFRWRRTTRDRDGTAPFTMSEAATEYFDNLTNFGVRLQSVPDSTLALLTANPDLAQHVSSSADFLLLEHKRTCAQVE
jgi:hypothetical protein